MSEPTKRVISAGLGVQSTTLLLLAAHGEIGPMPDAAFFSDTKAEPRWVYEHLRWLQSGNVLPFPLHVVGKASGLYQDLMGGTNSGGKRRYAAIPAFLDRTLKRGATVDVLDVDDQVVGSRTIERDTLRKEGIGRRQCTKEYKLEPLTKAQRELLGFGPRERIPPGAIEVWIGISVDEVVRATPSRVAWQVHRHPLLELRMTRGDCVEWLKRNGYPIPKKSACTFCPYRSNAEWRDLKENDKEGWRQALEVDAAIRGTESGYARDLKFKPYLHRSLKPLGEVDLRSDEEVGQHSLFDRECLGMCGV